MQEENISHYFFKYDLLEYNFKDIYESCNLSYFSKDNNLLSDGVIDLNELEKYESIEKNTKESNIVLIKKFKLRISVNKNDDFSDEIIVSDVHDLDLTNFSHFEELIKIALIRDNIDEWVKSGNLNYYDFIFTTNEEYLDLLKKDYGVFIINGKSIYLQLKNILNLLYMRRKEKFHYFVNKKFHYIFPKFNNYFKILHSELFDGEWYRNAFDIPNNTDPVIHYLMVGYIKGYSAGPDFDSWDYYMLNPDVKEAKMNPLVHYEIYGKKEEHRIYKFADEYLKKRYRAILNSPYFDKEWYDKTYDFSKEEWDSVDHYLRIGFKRGFNPGPNFDTNAYFECNGDVKKAGLNPLFHYEMYGRKENRSIRLEKDG